MQRYSRLRIWCAAQNFPRFHVYCFRYLPGQMLDRGSGNFFCEPLGRFHLAATRRLALVLRRRSVSARHRRLTRLATPRGPTTNGRLPAESPKEAHTWVRALRVRGDVRTVPPCKLLALNRRRAPNRASVVERHARLASEEMPKP